MYFRLSIVIALALSSSVLSTGCKDVPVVQCCPAEEAASQHREETAVERVFTLVQENRASCSLILPADASPAAVKAVSNFGKTLKTITGADLPVVRDEVSGNRIVLEIRPVKSLKTADDFVITFPDERTMKIEGTESSIQWAFNHIIREFAHAEWVLPEECGLSYTPMKDLVIPARTIEGKDVSWNISRVHNISTIWHLQNMRQGIRIGHDLTKHAFPGEKYGKDNSWPKAVMPVLRGEKLTAPPDPKQPNVHWQPCYSNPETARIAAENLLEYLEKNPGTQGLSLGTNDNNGFCECAECLKLDKNRRSNRSESYFTFINRVLDVVCKKYPDLLVSVFAYTYTYPPPSFKLHPNAVVFLTIDFNSCADPKLLARHKKIIAEWSEKASLLGVWDYSWGYPYPAPRLYAPYHLDMLKYMFEHKARAYYGESWTCDAHEGPKHYLLSKLLWDSNQDMKKLEEEWYVRCVGEKAAPYLKAYYKIWNDYFTGPVMKTPWFRSAPAVYMTYKDVSCIYALREEEIQSADEAMKMVVELAETEQEKQRAELLMRLWRQTFLRLRMLGAGVYDDQGFIHTPRQALQLLQCAARAKEYQTEYDRIGTALSKDRNLKPYYLSKPYIAEGASPVGQKYDDAVISHILAAAAFASDPDVDGELKRLSSDPAVPDMIRQFCRAMGSLDHLENLLPAGNAEQGITEGYEIHPQLRWGGTLSVSEKNTSEGKKSFMVSISGHDTLFWILGKAKPGTMYLATFKAFIPQLSPEGYLNVALYAEKNGINQQWRNLPQLKLSGGIWQTFSVITTTKADSDSVRLRIYMKEFESGEEIFIDDIRLIEIGKAVREP